MKHRLLAAAFAAVLLLPAALHADDDNKKLAQDFLDIITERYKMYPDSIRTKALESLAKLGPDARPAVPGLMDIVKERFKSYDEGYRLRAMEAVSTILGGDDTNVEAQLRYLQDKDEAVRLKAAKVLGRLGPQAKAAVPALSAAAQKDADEDVRRVAAAALEKIQGKK
jgi:HEAT repeat protein